jgi:Flp pilus assembly protein TadD
MNPNARIQVLSSGLLGLIVLSLLCAPSGLAQDDPSRVVDPNFLKGDLLSSVSAPAANVFVSVRETTGLPVSTTAMVKLSCPLTGVDTGGPTKGASAQILFRNVPMGDCRVEVSAPGYKPAKEHTEVVQSVTNRIQYVYVYLHPESEPASGARAPIVPQKALKEIDKGMAAMQSKRDDEALKHLTKASQLAPSSPDVAYLLGVLALNRKDLAAAGQHFQAAVNYAPSHDRALLELGYVQMETSQWNSAVQTLERALQINTTSSRAHLLAANAYAQLHNYAKAQEHAQRAEEFGSENAAPARTLLAEILAAQGNREGAKLEFEAVLRDFPNAASASVAKQGLQNLANPNSQATPSVSGSSVAETMVGRDAAADVRGYCHCMGAAECGHFGTGGSAGCDVFRRRRCRTHQQEHRPSA